MDFQRGTWLLKLFFASGFLVLGQLAWADLENDPLSGQERIGEREGFLVEYIGYEEYVYSQSKKTELGDSQKLNLGLRYQFAPGTFGRLRFKTDEERYSNRTSNFEFLIGHSIENLEFQFDSDLESNDRTNGGMTFGADLSSELTKIAYKSGDSFTFTFYPFNFDGEVGYDFKTNDVTTIYYIDGAPDTILATPANSSTDKIVTKTIPGIELKFTDGKFASYIGMGSASYLYPQDASYNIVTSPTAPQWERREDIGFKAGVGFNGENFRFSLEFAGHDKARETGSLLAQGASFYGISNLSRFVLETEATWTRAGALPYRVSSANQWFEKTAVFQPVYADIASNKLHDWIDKAGSGVSMRVGFRVNESFVPYVGVKSHSEFFVYDNRLSAHRLRTNDETLSHGGLSRVGVGFYKYAGDFVINPEIEHLTAKNEVFGNASDVREDRQTATLNKSDFSIFLTVLYQFGGNNLFKP